MFKPSKFERQVVIVGNGCRGADLTPVFESEMPIVTSWGGADLVADHPNHIGHCGIFGDRASNFAVQNADCLLVLGCRLSVPMTGHNFPLFATKAKIFMVDLDRAEILKPSLSINGKFRGDVRDYLRGFDFVADGYYLRKCIEWREKYPVVLPEYRTQEKINSYYFVEQLSYLLDRDAVVVTDMGTAFTCTFQAAKMKKGQRWFTAYGHAPMGYGLPGAIGAYYATGKPVVCIVGDGALQFNIQELQTIAHNKLPITIFVLNNGGYLTMKHMQASHFGRMVGADESSGVSCPDTIQIANAYGLPAFTADKDTLVEDLESALKLRCICEIVMDPSQPLIPRVQSVKNPDGSISAKPIEDMYPYLPREEFAQNMQCS